jgi:hypothetical protein
MSNMENFTGAEYGETFTDEHGIRWHQVFEYENGECVDRYVTKVGVQL